MTLREKHSRTTLRATENFPACLAFFSAPAARPAIRTGFFMDLPGLSVSVSRAYPFHAATLLAPFATSKSDLNLEDPSLRTPPVTRDLRRPSGGVRKGLGRSPLRRSRRARVLDLRSKSWPRGPWRTPERGDPERSVGPYVGASGFAPLCPRTKGAAVKAEGAGSLAKSNG